MVNLDVDMIVSLATIGGFLIAVLTFRTRMRRDAKQARLEAAEANRREGEHLEQIRYLEREVESAKARISELEQRHDEDHDVLTKLEANVQSALAWLERIGAKLGVTG